MMSARDGEGRFMATGPYVTRRPRRMRRAWNVGASIVAVVMAYALVSAYLNSSRAVSAVFMLSGYRVVDHAGSELEALIVTGGSDTVERCEVLEETNDSVAIECRGIEVRGGNQPAIAIEHRVPVTLESPLGDREVTSSGGPEVRRFDH